LRPSLTTSRTIAVVASALGLCTACFYSPSPSHQPPPPDLVVVSTDTLYFSAAVAQVSAPQHFSIANTTSTPVSISPQTDWLAKSKSNPFSLQTDCGLTLASNASCMVTVTFHPTIFKGEYMPLRMKFHGDEIHVVELRARVSGDFAPAKP
jgi:hypothetical protein